MRVPVTTEGRTVWIDPLDVVEIETGHPCYAGSTTIWFDELAYLIVAETPAEIIRRCGVRPRLTARAG